MPLLAMRSPHLVEPLVLGGGAVELRVLRQRLNYEAAKQDGEDSGQLPSVRLAWREMGSGCTRRASASGRCGGDAQQRWSASERKRQQRASMVPGAARCSRRASHLAKRMSMT